MGVDLGGLLEKREINLEYLAGRTIGIDSFNVLYQFLSSIRGADGSPLIDSKGRVTSHLTGLLYRTASIVERDIKPVFAFDGTPSKLKEKTREERRRIRTEAGKKYDAAKKEGDEKKMKKYAQQSLRLTGEMIEESKKLVRLMGFPVIEATGEGEAQIAVMAQKGDIFAAASQDFDTLLFGTPRLIRNMTVSGRRKVPGKDLYIEVKPELLDLEYATTRLGISRKKLVWIAILIGTDFNDKFPNIGPKRALDLVKKFDSFEEIVSSTEHEPDFDYKDIEKIFLEPRVQKEYDLKFELPDKEGIKHFLCDERSFSEERVEKAIERIKVKMEQKGEQSRLNAWG